MSPAAPLPIDYKALVLDDRIHASLYTDPRIFADKMDRIFHAGWVFVGHDSEIPRRRGLRHPHPRARARHHGRRISASALTACPRVTTLML
jgi:hypothetical protein